MVLSIKKEYSKKVLIKKNKNMKTKSAQIRYFWNFIHKSMKTFRLSKGQKFINEIYHNKTKNYNKGNTNEEPFLFIFVVIII